MIAFTDFILNHKDDIDSSLMVMAFCTSLVICLARYKDKLWEYIKNRRNCLYVSWLIVSAALLFCFEQRKYIIGLPFLICVIIWTIYAILVLISLRPKLNNNYTHPLLLYYVKKLNEGDILRYLSFFDKDKHWFLSDRDIQVEYNRLRAAYFSSVKDYEKAYKSLEAIDYRDLYAEEKISYDQLKAIYLTQMGSMSAALAILGDPEGNNSKDPYVWISYAYIYEQVGDISKAFEYAKKAKDFADVSALSDYDKAKVYNDYARTALFNGNRGEALQYWRIAYKKVENSKDIRVYEVLVSNLIFNMAREGVHSNSCDKILKQYKAKIKKQSVDNKLAYYNCAVSYYRQIKDDDRVYKLIKNGYKELIGQLDYIQAEIFKACTFRMLMNGKYVHDWFDGDVSVDYATYVKLDTMTKLQVFKEYIGILQQTDFRTLLNHEPYKTLYQTIMYYYEHDAIDEINECLNEVESYNVYSHKELEMQKLGILKLIQKERHIELSKKIYLDLVDKLYNYGLRIEATGVLTIFIDECGSPYNLLVCMPGWPKPLFYYDFVNRIELPPDPILMPDKIHLGYFKMNTHPLMTVIPIQIQLIQENIDRVINKFDSWKDHPVKIEMSIWIAHNLLLLDRKSEAKRFYQYFKDSNISELGFTAWFRDEIDAFTVELAD